MKNQKAKPQTTKISTDFELAVAAHNGDQEATNILWDRYRFNMIGVLGKYNNRLYQLSQDEMESEAAEVFMHKLKEVFKPEKVKKSPDDWKFSYMLSGGMRNHRNTIIEKSRNYELCVGEYDERDALAESEQRNYSVTRALEWDDREYTKYDPEILNINKEWADAKVKVLHQKLTPFQKAVLNLREAGMSLRQIADRMGCGYTKVRIHINNAKQVAAEVFCI